MPFARKQSHLTSHETVAVSAIQKLLDAALVGSMLVSRRPPSHTSFSWGVASSNVHAPSSHTFFSWCADRAVTHTVLDRSHPTRDVDDGGDDGGDDDGDDDHAIMLTAKVW